MKTLKNILFCALFAVAGCAGGGTPGESDGDPDVSTEESDIEVARQAVQQEVGPGDETDFITCWSDQGVACCGAFGYICCSIDGDIYCG